MTKVDTFSDICPQSLCSCDMGKVDKALQYAVVPAVAESSKTLLLGARHT